MRFLEYIDEEIINENIFRSVIQQIRNLSKKKMERLARDSWIQLVDIAREAGLEDKLRTFLSSKLGIRIGSLDKVSKARVVESETLDEDWKHWWDTIAGEGFFNIKFYPALQTWFEASGIITSLLKNQAIDPANLKKLAFFAILWLALASGKFIKDFHSWKKENRDEYYAERPELAKKHGYVFKDPNKDPNKKKTSAGFV